MRPHRRLDQLAILKLEKEIVSRLLDRICKSKVEFGIKDRSKVLDGTRASANYLWHLQWLAVKLSKLTEYDKSDVVYDWHVYSECSCIFC